MKILRCLVALVFKSLIDSSTAIELVRNTTGEINSSKMNCRRQDCVWQFNLQSQEFLVMSFIEIARRGKLKKATLTLPGGLRLVNSSWDCIVVGAPGCQTPENLRQCIRANSAFGAKFNITLRTKNKRHYMTADYVVQRCADTTTSPPGILIPDSTKSVTRTESTTENYTNKSTEIPTTGGREESGNGKRSTLLGIIGGVVGAVVILLVVLVVLCFGRSSRKSTNRPTQDTGRNDNREDYQEESNIYECPNEMVVGSQYTYAYEVVGDRTDIASGMENATPIFQQGEGEAVSNCFYESATGPQTTISNDRTTTQQNQGDYYGPTAGELAPDYKTEPKMTENVLYNMR